MKTITDIAQVISGHHFRERLAADPEGDVAVIQMKDVSHTEIVPSTSFARVRLSPLPERGALKEGDLIVRARGERNLGVLVRGHFERTVIAAPLTLIRVDSSLVEPGYMAWFINHPMTQAQLAGLATGSHVRTVSKAALEALPIPVPPMTRQRQIVEFAALAQAEIDLVAKISESRKRLTERILWQYAQDAR